MAYTGCDALCLLGDQVIQRTRGWPMGGSVSEPATSIDLGEDTRLLYTDRSTQLRVGLAYGEHPMPSLVQGVQHVDDALLCSRL